MVPVALQAGLAEAVAAGRGDGLHEHLQTDGAAELVLGEDPASRGAYAWKKKGREAKTERHDTDAQVSATLPDSDYETGLVSNMSLTREGR